MRRSLMMLPSLLWTLLSASCASAGSGTIWATPHDSYSSSVGVLGCKINTDRVAYWPDAVDCSNICVSVSHGGRQVHLLRADQSGGAHDMSYDAWNYLYTGYPATSKPAAGGAVAMDYADVDASMCRDLIKTKGGKLPLSASNSMNFLSSCLERSGGGGGGSWVAENYVLYNILDPICTYGFDETCSLDFPAQNQAKCPNPLGTPAALTTDPVYNIRYPTGEKVLASSGQQAGSTSAATATARGQQAATRVAWVFSLVGWQMLRFYLS